MVPRAPRFSTFAAALLVGFFASRSAAQSPADRVLLVVNDNSSLSRSIADYYVRRRNIPARNICHLTTLTSEDISRSEFDRQIARPLADFLRKSALEETIYYIVTTAGVPLRIPGTPELTGNAASVDSELTLLYSDLHSAKPHAIDGVIPNPFFGRRDQPFSHPEFPIYLVTRLAAYDFDGVKGIIDRALAATNRGKFVLDLSDPDNREGNNWLRDAATQLPKDRVVLEDTAQPIWDQTDVIGYASWGSNDANHHRRFPGFHWLPGGIVTEYVSTDGRTFAKPPDKWMPGRAWNDPSTWFGGAPQSLLADYFLEGATGGSGHVYEPYLVMTPRPDLLFAAYYSGRNLAESFYLSIRSLSWQNIVVGDPLCSLGAPPH